MSISSERAELAKLQVLAESMSKDTFAYKTITGAIVSITSHISGMECDTSRSDISVKVKLSDTDSLILNKVPRGCSLSGLKQLILGGVEGEHSWLHRNSAVRLYRLPDSQGAPELLYDDGCERGEGARTLQECGVVHNAVVAISLCGAAAGWMHCPGTGTVGATPMDTESDPVGGGTAADATLNPLTYGQSAGSAFLAVMLALHLHLTRACGFSCMVAAPGKPVPGFAPSLRELPSGRVTPEGWDADPTAAVLTYRHRSKPGALWVLVGTQERGAADARISFSKKVAKGSVPPECCQVLLAVDGLCRSAGGPSGFALRSEGALFEWFLPLVGRLLPDVASAAVSVSSPVPAASSVQPSVFSTFNAHAVPLATARVVVPPEVVVSTSHKRVGRTDDALMIGGRSGAVNPDLEPNFGQTAPGSLRIPGVGYDPLGGRGDGARSGGMIVGPDSDLFRGDGVDDESGYPLAPGFEFQDPSHPGVRYDPLLPPGSGLGVPGRGRGRGRGRGLPRSQFPGEPNPDHLKPPGW